MNTLRHLRQSGWLASLLFLLLTFTVQAQKTRTSVHGIVRDSLTDEELAYVTITFEGAGVGTRSDINGNFYLESDKSPRKIKVSYVGFGTQILPITPGVHNEVVVKMSDANLKLAEISIKPKKYSRKNNPAVDLVEEVFKHKDQNRKESLDFYSFEKYEKVQFDLNGITDKFRRKWYFRPFRFIFNNVDTNQVTHKVALPFYLRERLVNAYYRKDPQGQKAKLLGEHQSGFHEEEGEEDGLGLDANGVSAFLNSTFADVDIYEPQIQLLGTAFVGPLSGIANSMYRFYIEDTLEIDGTRYADVFFAPRNKADLAFMGNFLVALDSTYAVMKVEMGVSKDINLNWVTDLRIEQEFARVGEGDAQRLLLINDRIVIDFNILKRSQGRSLLTHKTSRYKNYTLNQPLPDSLFVNKVLLEDDTGKVKARPLPWWQERRHVALTPSEQFVDRMADSVQKVPAFRFLNGLGKLMGTGYQRLGFFDLGPVGTFYSFNDIEGFRGRIGGRTNSRLYKPLVLEGYAVYGFRDKRWKYQMGATYSFSGKVPRAFPQNQLTVSYQRDLRVPGLALDRVSQDNFLLSVQRTANNRMLLNQVWKAEYKREFQNQFSFSVAAQQKQFNAAGTLSFELSGSDPDNPQYAASMNTTEWGAFFRWAPHQQFYVGPTYRLPIPSRFPIFTATFRQGLKGIAGGEYAFQKVVLTAEKRFFVAPFGISDWTLTAGRIWGSVPYPLLEIHPANQSYIYDWYAFNLMNFLEFVSDRYATLSVQHNFNGFVLNKIPLIKKLQWRENLSFKALYGGLGASNNPGNQPGLFKFPTDEAGNPITHSLDHQPYLEASVGISNIFHLVRLDYVWRINYKELPGATRWGIRVMLTPKF